MQDKGILDETPQPKLNPMTELVRSHAGLVNRHKPWANPRKPNPPKSRKGGSKARKILKGQR